MAKLSTDALKAMITGWISRPDVVESIDREFDDWFGEYDTTDPEEVARYEGCYGRQFVPLRGESIDDSRERMREAYRKLWTGPKAWARCEKRRLGEDVETFFYLHHDEMVFSVDWAGDSDTGLTRSLVRPVVWRHACSVGSNHAVPLSLTTSDSM